MPSSFTIKTIRLVITLDRGSFTKGDNIKTIEGLACDATINKPGPPQKNNATITIWGLSPDSMGLYRTWLPRVGLTDARRIWISNVRPAGLGHDAAAFKLSHLLNQARLRQLSGVDLKDDTEAVAPATIEERSLFLLG